ncbi:MAG: hypothetical protein IH891_03580 [Planctomycetes bacterium]|nr:hypothetical protein [Planctomycetota bacterium]
MKQVKDNPALAGPGIMFISAALFGYFGFFTGGLMHTNLLNQFVLFFALLDWTLKGTACGFVLGGLLTLARPVLGNLFYGITGLLSAIFFVLIAVMDIMDKQNAAAAPPVLLLIFAAWNGYGSWFGIRAILDLLRHLPDLPSDPGSETRGEG